MRVIQMHPHEVRTPGMLGQPIFRVSHDVHAAALQTSPSRFARRVLREVVVEIEPSTETWGKCLTVENHRTDKGGSAIAALFQQFCHSWMCARQGHGEIRDPVRSRQKTGENAGMGCVGDGAGSKCLCKPHTVFGQSVQSRSRPVGISVAVNVVSTQSINSDQENIVSRRLWGCRGTDDTGHAGQVQADNDNKRLHRLIKRSTAMWRSARFRLLAGQFERNLSRTDESCVRIAYRQAQVVLAWGHIGAVLDSWRPVERLGAISDERYNC